jgi:hypothetical protein
MDRVILTTYLLTGVGDAQPVAGSPLSQPECGLAALFQMFSYLSLFSLRRYSKDLRKLPSVSKFQPVRLMRTGFLATFWPNKKVSDGYSRIQRAPRRATEGRALGRARISRSCTWARPPENPHPWRSLFVLSRVRRFPWPCLRACTLLGVASCVRCGAAACSSKDG